MHAAHREALHHGSHRALEVVVAVCQSRLRTKGNGPGREVAVVAVGAAAVNRQAVDEDLAVARAEEEQLVAARH